MIPNDKQIELLKVMIDVIDMKSRLGNSHVFNDIKKMDDEIDFIEKILERGNYKGSQKYQLNVFRDKYMNEIKEWFKNEKL